MDRRRVRRGRRFRIALGGRPWHLSWRAWPPSITWWSHFPAPNRCSIPCLMLLRAGIVASEARAYGNVMLDQRLERPAAKRELARLDAEAKRLRRARFGRSTSAPRGFRHHAECRNSWTRADGGDACAPPRTRAASPSKACFPRRPRRASSSARVWSWRGMESSPPDEPSSSAAAFGHPSEEMFANLLDFYRIQWEYEPRSVPAAMGQGRQRHRSFHAGFLSARVRSVRRAHHHEAGSGDAKESQGQAAARNLSAYQHPGVLSEGFSGPGVQIRARA